MRRCNDVTVAVQSSEKPLSSFFVAVMSHPCRDRPVSRDFVAPSFAGDLEDDAPRSYWVRVTGFPG
jgi:hypothetical protein